MSSLAVKRRLRRMSDCVMTSVCIFPGCCVARIRLMPGCRPSRRSVMSALDAAVFPTIGKNSCASSMTIQTRGIFFSSFLLSSR